MPTILLVRHGETHWNREKRIQGHGDSPLTLKGIEQAKAYGRTLAGLIGDVAGWRVIASPLPRCVQTAAILCEVAGLDFTTIAFEDRLKEISTGQWAGRLKAEMDPAELTGSGLDSWFFRCPGGETHAQVSARLSHWLAERVGGEKLVVVGHGVSGRILRGLHAKINPDEAPCGESPQDVVFRLRAGRIERIACI
ncbi:MAG: histidine phosphatase family protein [Rhodospirillaceae bacterium]|nr:histidine phosphatase family protein [Rhodospirillales bacterium]